MSFAPREQYALQWWADDMIALLDSLGVLHAHLLGHHTGAAIAATIAARHPDRTASLAMVGAVAMSPADRARWHAGVTAMTPAADGAHLLTAWEQVGTIDADLAFAPDVALRHREAVDKLRAGVRWHEAYLAVFSTDVGALLEAVAAPALLLCGTSDVLHPYVPETRRAIPHARYVPLEGGGYILDQDPATVLEHYIEFLTDVSEEVECPPADSRVVPRTRQRCDDAPHRPPPRSRRCRCGGPSRRGGLPGGVVARCGCLTACVADRSRRGDLAVEPAALPHSPSPGHARCPDPRRAGWFVSGRDTGTTCSDDSERWSAGTATAAERQDALADYLAATAALGNSWEPDALVADVPSGRYVDADCVHVTNYHGPYFSTRGPLNAPRPPQGRAVRFAEYRPNAAESDVADVLVVGSEEDIPAARASADRVLLKVAGDAAAAPPVTSADGYAFCGVTDGRLLGQVLHETLPALVPTPRGGLLRDRFGLSASDFEFVPYHAEQEVPV